MAKPFVKWVGGKSQLIPEITQRLPEYIKKGMPYIYVEPFSGSAAFALHLLDSEHPPSAIILNDINSDLVNLYKVVKSYPHELLAYLKTLQAEYDELDDKEAKQPYYYAKREAFNTREADNIKHAGLFIFLNRAGFNGLYRVNSKNKFNVPIGSYKKPNFVFEDTILQASKVLTNVEIYNQSYEDTLRHLEQSNKSNLPAFFYFDPPYKPLSESSSFTSYSKDSFDDEDQERLKSFCDLLDKKGYQWLLSNSDTTNLDANNTYFDTLYSNYKIDRVQANRSINSKGSKRGQINELLIRNYSNMDSVTNLNNLYQNEHFEKFVNTLNIKGILQYDYFVNWAKVLNNIEPIEKELNLLNTAVGKENIEKILFDIFKSYPNTIKAIPFLLAIRDKSVDILIDKTNYIHKNFNFRQTEFSKNDIDSLVDFVMQSGLGELIKSKQIKSLPDYCTGVEVGLDSNGRKNRGGTQMEQLVESFVAIFCHDNNLGYLAQANAKKIKDTWNIELKVDKSSRIIDFVIYREQDKKLFFIEVNFYNGGGSKLKSTATEYIEMSRFWKDQDVEFIWVTDGKGWIGTQNPLRDYFERQNLLINIDMIQNGYLEKVICN
ncbi:DpnII family type II restriction endonuclease [Psychrobacter sp. N25K4-3-2]|uniref:DpnII family type II restriction endonuclease n=1 Tax=Psychrobacter sp. N25K4-3-2 TaxID=2785026 RepID=UPI002234417D|nr:DpnII family type II restriction endonuclease [Psychrobacter sp. N25K4-3-2]